MKRVILFFSIITSVAFGATDKDTVLKAIGPYAYEVNYFPDSSFKDLIFTFGTTERQDVENGYMDTYQKYSAWGIKSQIQPFGVPVLKPGTSPGKLKHKVPQALSIVLFKRGETKVTCDQVVKSALELGIKRISFYHPVHYSGGNDVHKVDNDGAYKMPDEPILNQHYRYEDTFGISQKDFNQCLKSISDANLQLHFVPHLQGIEGLIEPNERGHWRLLSGIPINQTYFHKMFDHLLDFLKSNPTSFREQGQLDITIAAEIDPMVFSYAEELDKGLIWLKNSLTEKDVRNPRYFINTNGDFYHGMGLIKERGHDCNSIEKILSKIDGFTPSMYGESGHLKVGPNGRLSLDETLLAYKNDFIQRMKILCPGSIASFKEIINSKPIGFGEFAIQDVKGQAYTDILKEANNKILFVQYWNYGSWDHLGIISPGNPRLRKELVAPISYREN